MPAQINRGAQICDNCYEQGHKEDREYTSMGVPQENEIVWYECGHILIIKDGLVRQQFNFADES